MDFVTYWPESTASGYTGILVIVVSLTRIVIDLPCREDIDSPELARMIFKHAICKRGVPDNITSDWGNVFPSRFWDRVCSHLRNNHRLSTAFHLQMDGQSSGRTKQWSSTCDPCETTSWTTGSNCYRWLSSPITTPTTIPSCWHPSGRTVITTLRCSLSLPRTPVADHRCRQTRGWQAWKRVPIFSGKT